MVSEKFQCKHWKFFASGNAPPRVTTSSDYSPKVRLYLPNIAWCLSISIVNASATLKKPSGTEALCMLAGTNIRKIRNWPNSPNIIARQNFLIYSMHNLFCVYMSSSSSSLISQLSIAAPAELPYIFVCIFCIYFCFCGGGRGRGELHK